MHTMPNQQGQVFTFHENLMFQKHHTTAQNTITSPIQPFTSEKYMSQGIEVNVLNAMLFKLCL